MSIVASAESLDVYVHTVQFGHRSVALIVDVDELTNVVFVIIRTNDAFGPKSVYI